MFACLSGTRGLSVYTWLERGKYSPIWKRRKLTRYSDGNIRYYEYENDNFEYLSEYKSADPQRGVAFMPKRGLNLQENEVMRAYKTVNDTYIEPISFIVPRRAEVFQGDIYPPATGSKPGMSAADYFSGKDALPPKIDMESVYNNEAPAEVPSDYKPPPPLTPMPAPETKKPEPPKEAAREAPQPSPALKTPASMKEQGASMSSMASKFADSKDEEEEEEEEDDSSSFEEVSKPVERAQAKPTPRADKFEAAPATSRSTQPPAQATPSMWKVSTSQPTIVSNTYKTKTDPAVHQPATTHNTAPSTSSPPSQSSTTTPTTTSATQPPSSSTTADPGLASSLDEIKALLQQQKTTMAAQSEMIVQLSSELESLRRNVASASADTSEKDERIRALEREVKALRG